MALPLIWTVKICIYHNHLANGESAMESLLPLIVQLISGAVRGNIAGSLMKNLSLGTLTVNS